MKAIDILLSKYLKDELNHEERQLLFEFITDEQNEGYVHDWLNKELDQLNIAALNGVPSLKNNNADIIFNRIINDVKTDPKSSSNIRYLITGWRKYAAILIFLAGLLIIYFSTTHRTQNDSLVKNAATNPIGPANGNAILTLSDGSEVVLNDSINHIIEDGRIKIKKESGLLTYNTGMTSDAAGITYNIMKTPRGGQYQLILPDGSRVWLNSTSSLRYPVVFGSAHRIVELTGEAYFEIKENKQKPFFVQTKKATIAVLGTEFNVNAYENEPEFAATLVEGSIKVSAGDKKQIIKPGEQANIKNTSGDFDILIPNVEKVLAWKTGVFQFENASIKNIMRQIERWYDVSVEYKGIIPDAEFSGSLRRTESANGLLNALSLTKKVHFVIDGKKIVVIKGVAAK